MSETADTKPFAPFEWLLAGRYLRARRREGFISVIAGFSFLGIMLGVGTLIIVMAVMNGFRQELFDKILGLNGHVIVQSASGRFTDYNEVAERIRKVPGVKQVLPLVEGQAMISTPTAASGVLVRGLSEKDLTALTGVSEKIRFGSLEGLDQKPGLVIGARLANSFSVQVGDELTLVAPRGATTPMGTTPRIKRYPIAAIFELGMTEYDSGIAFLPLNEAQLYFSQPQRVTVLEVLIDEPDRVGEIRDKIVEAGGPTIYVSDWRERNASFFDALQVERNVMFLILTLIVLVAALNIVSGLIMLVKDKGQDIAILRTMGATRGAVMRIFFITGASIGVIGTLAGLLIGIVVCANIESIRQFIAWSTNTDLFSSELYYLSRMPAEMDPSETLSVVLMAFALSLLATLYPAWRASRLDPVEALRYE